MWSIALALCGAALSAAAEPPKASTQSWRPPPRQAPVLPPSLNKDTVERMLQIFVDRLHGKAFRHLGDERDFDHGHFLFGDDPERPVAVLYHTQELAYYHASASPFGYLDPEARNWLQWIDQPERIENARDYLRREYPATRIWDWFRRQELPALEKHRTIVDKMLDPERLGLASLSSRQWVFSRAECGSPASEISVTISGERVCLKLSHF